MNDPYYGPDGTLFVWTGTGYQALPKIAQSDLSLNQATAPQYYTQGDNEFMANVPTGPDVGFASGDLASKYGLGDANWSGLSDNYQTSWDVTDPNSLNLLLKSADKTGTNVGYTLKDGYYVPTLGDAQYWNTNGTAMDYIAPLALMGGMMAMPFLPAIGGAAASGAEGALSGTGFGSGIGAGTGAPMTTYGILDTSMALPGTTFIDGLAGAGGAAAGSAAGGASATPSPMTTYGVLDTSMALPGTEFVPGIGSGIGGAAAKIGTSLLSNPNALKALGVVAGGLLGGANDSSSGSGGPTPAINQPVPQMYGGNAAPPSFQTYGPTQTEKYLTQQYLPSLFGQQAGLLDNWASGAQQQTPAKIRTLLGY